ncbi:MAG: DUF1810 domain-containing protein [Muribaculaceae bacterium]|jgi:uncharacterized protein (DUF1810 family)|nr:DUF1810 domain-containing protein [Muribaculaceae bacterium]
MEYDLNRFCEALDFAYELALGEMRAGRKRSHWIWYVFPQVKGLGRSYNARYYALDGVEEARQFLNDEELGGRLREITEVVLEHRGIDVEDLMNGEIDAVKLRSSMTLFDIVSPNDIFAQVLEAFFDGNRCEHTLEICGE